MRLQETVGKLGAELEANEAATYAGIFIQHEPEYRVVARFTRGGEETLGRYVEDGPLEGLVEAESASATLAKLRLSEFNATRLVRGLGIPNDSAVDVAGNRVELRVTDGRGLFRALGGATGVRLPEEVVVVEVPELTQPAASSLAGLRLFRFDFPTTTWCTSGFTVRRDADTEGVLTAAHCTGRARDNERADFRMHYKSDGDLVFLPREGRRLYGSWDLEWHTTPGYDDLAVFYDGSEYRSVYGLKRRTETSPGDVVCDYGRTTGYSCSIVNSVNARISFVHDSSATFIETRIRKSGGMLTDDGDSGGPVFRGNSAAGIISARRSDADYYYMEYTASGYPEDMLVSIQTY